MFAVYNYDVDSLRKGEELRLECWQFMLKRQKPILSKIFVLICFLLFLTNMSGFPLPHQVMPFNPPPHPTSLYLTCSLNSMGMTATLSPNFPFLGNVTNF